MLPGSWRRASSPLLAGPLLAGTLLASALLAGCELGPDAPPEPTSPPAAFSELAASTSAATSVAAVASGEPGVDYAFWRDLHDPILTALVERALARSPDVASATARIRESRAVAGAAWAALLPEADAGASYQRTHLSTETPLLSQFAGANLPGLQFSPDADDYKASLSMAYELDLWGKNRRAHEAAVAELKGDVHRRRSIGLTLAGELVTTYVDERTLEERRAIALRTLESRRAALAIARDRSRGGLANDLDVARAETDLANVVASVADLDRLLATSEHKLAVLAGGPPGSLRATLAAPHPPLAPIEVPVGLPAQLLVRRPDLRELSERLAAATARIGQAKADVFPTLELTGEVGVEATDPKKLASRAAGYWNAGPALKIPLFDWGRRIENWTAAEERAEQARCDLEKQVLVALEEVEDALASAREDARRRDALMDAAAASVRATAIAEAKYRGGLVSQLEALDARRTQFQAEDALADARGRALKDAVQLAKAVGGGFGVVEALLPPVEKPDPEKAETK